MAPQITLYFLQASRCIRTAWQLEELGLDYNVDFSEREANKAPQAFKDKSGDALGKFPLLKDGELLVCESGAIAEYLCDHYDPEHKLIPTEPSARVKVQRWLHAAEATYLLHGLAITYARWFTPDEHAAAKAEEGMSANVQRDMDFLENELKKGGGRFLVGDGVTAGDIMMLFSVQFILARGLGTKGRTWPVVDEWVRNCEATGSYKKAVERTGYKL